jgi:hypothetical protein
LCSQSWLSGWDIFLLFIFFYLLSFLRPHSLSLSLSRFLRWYENGDVTWFSSPSLSTHKRRVLTTERDMNSPKLFLPRELLLLPSLLLRKVNVIYLYGCIYSHDFPAPTHTDATTTNSILFFHQRTDNWISVVHFRPYWH